MTEIPKAYEPQSVEDKWYDFWVKQNCFTADPARVTEQRPAYSIVIPPPNVTGMLHMGHVLNNTIQDILARKARMDGKEVLWLPGTDHAGIATQVQVEKALKKEERLTKYDLGREKFLERVWSWKEKHGGIIINQLKKLGCSCDWTRERFTMDAEYSRCVQKVFVELYKKGLIYRGKRMVNWCPVSQTALSDEEVEMKPQKGFMYHFKVEVAETPGTWLTIATTRPETIPGDTAVAVNPKDPRYAHLIGQHIVRPLPAELPRAQKLIPIIGDDHVDFEFGTGVLKVTPAHDKADFEIGARHKLPVVDIMNPDGTMNTLAGGPLAGLDRFQARKVAVDLLREQGALVEEKPYENNVGFSQRADVPIEPRLSEQWFLKYPAVAQSKASVEQSSLLDKTVTVVSATGQELRGTSIKELRHAALAYARGHGFLGKPFKNDDSGLEIRVGRQGLSHAFSNFGEANIKSVVVLPELIQKAIWLSSEPHEPINPLVKQVHRLVAALSLGGELHSVLITAKEYFDGTVHYDHRAKKMASGGKSLEAHPREGKLDTQPAPNAEAKVRDLLVHVKRSGLMRFHPDRWAKVYDHWLTNIQDWCISRQLWWGHRVPVWYRDGEVHCGLEAPQGEGWQQDPDVLDTWFSSWLWPFATMGWPEKTDTLRKFYPTTDLVTGPDIIFFWVARMIMAGYEFMDELPFKNVYFTGIIRDKQGRKMSKTLGNSPDPLDLIARYGADALRFGTMRSAPLGQDVLFDEKDVELGRNFCNKLWNACRFRQMQGGETEGEIAPALLTSDDKWILLRLDQAIREVTDALASYNFAVAVQTLHRFFWSEYCDWYVEASKAAFFGDDAALKANTLAVIDFVLGHTLRLFHPFLPFITEELWHGMGFATDMPAEQGGKTIMTARWPKPLGEEFKSNYVLDESDEQFVATKHELVTLGRNLKAEFNISSKRVAFQFRPEGTLPAHELEVLRLLLNAEKLDSITDAPAKGTPAVRNALGELFLPLTGLVDFAAERARLGKELEKITGEIEKVQAKLANPSFAGKVPAAVLEEHQQRLADWQEKQHRASTAIAQLADA